ncbi:nucleotide disphospho-sugar-binding domain-containing protein [Streptomyces sp. NPDC021622]|uniref:nucleotide disphospho-sugar-binding domain-containing protein n=1 Tax=Streptomyces sp. NPDC021622 TaxID=3155013 RepID=UPI0033F3074E
MMTITPGTGHTYPMVPLAWALQMAGHEVLVVSCGPGLEMGNAGVRTVDVSPGLSLGMMQGKLAANHPELGAKLAQEALDANYLDIIGSAVAAALRLQPQMVEGMIRTAEQWRPDVIVHSPLLAPGLVAAAKLGIPAVQHEFGFVRPSGKIMRKAYPDLFEKHGVELPEVQATIDITPPSIQAPEPDSWMMGFVPYNGSGALPEPIFDFLTNAPAKPRIAITLGSGPAPEEAALIFRQVLEMAPKTDAEFVMVVPTVDLEPFGPLPDNVRSFGWAPYSSLMAHCSAVIHHGGPGSALGAIANGVPQVIPDFKGLARPLIADTMVQRGLARVVPPEEIGKELVESLLADTKLPAATNEVREEIRNMPKPHEVVDRLAALVEAGK